ncbi:MAG: phosphogluconate dehydratase [Rickettsiales bacterium]|nr:phosphogluconate dehydratase [Rickettsiales bacterium]
MHPTILSVTQRIREKSRPTRDAYVARMQAAASAMEGTHRKQLGCANLAHGFAGCLGEEKQRIKENQAPNIAIVSAYNEMLSAHQPYETYPRLIKDEALKHGATAQFAGGVPAMCDGITQGQDGMELSLFSRDTIALATAVSLSHNMFDGALMLGICDKIVPGMLMGALSFAHIPVVFVPGGPMPSGLSNKEKANVREQYAQGKVGRDELLEAESASYHSPGTCTFYGTANSNQMLMELMGLQLPGSSFINPYTPLRDALTRAATRSVIAQSPQRGAFKPLYQVFDERSVVNGIVGLHATGGSTNHTIHLIAIARAAGILIDWSDMAELSSVVPLLARVYPNGEADVNHFRDAGGLPKMVHDLIQAGLVHADAETVAGSGLAHYTQEPVLQDDSAHWVAGKTISADTQVVADVEKPFSSEGGLKLLQGNLGRAVIKISAVKPEHRFVEAPARVFTSQEAMQKAFNAGDLHGDLVAVVLFQGPAANGMPELHKLTPPLGVLQNMGFQVALVTDGRMSGASGKVPAAIHVSPECTKGGALAKVRDGDMIRLDAENGTLEALVDAAEWAARSPLNADISANGFGTGRELYHNARLAVTTAEEGASFIV